jgi:transketolase
VRNTFIEQLTIEARTNDRIFLLVGDLGFNVVDPFANAFPSRFLNVGVAEQNMTGVAAGLALEGYSVFTYSIANFPTLRCLEQIRNDVVYHGLDVTVVAVGGGFSYGPYGMSHHATEDLAIMRALPGMTVCAPGDPVETRYVTTNLVKVHGPKFLRLGKGGERNVHLEIPTSPFGEALPLLDKGGIAVLTTGSILSWVYEQISGDERYSLYSFPVIKPFPLRSLRQICEKHKQIICVEEHQLAGGFGSAVLEAVFALHSSGDIRSIPSIDRVAIPDAFVEIAGSQDFLREAVGLKLERLPAP